MDDVQVRYPRQTGGPAMTTAALGRATSERLDVRVGQAIDRQRLMAGVSKQQLAADMGVSQPYLRRRLTGQVSFTVRDLDLIRGRLGPLLIGQALAGLVAEPQTIG